MDAVRLLKAYFLFGGVDIDVDRFIRNGKKDNTGSCPAFHEIA